MDPDTFITAVYVLVDDLCRNECGPQSCDRRGRKPALSTSEVVTLALLAQWHHQGSERAFIRFAEKHWRCYFPLLSQSRFNRCVRSHGSLISRLAVRVGKELNAPGEELGSEAYEAIDGTVVPLMRRCRGQRARLFSKEEAWIGMGGSDRRWEYGVRLMASAGAEGGVSGFAVGPANVGERWLAEALFRWRHGHAADQPSPEELQSILGPAHRNKGVRKGPSGPLWPVEGAGNRSRGVYLADRGLRGRAWQQHWNDDYGAKVIVRPEDADSTLTPAKIRNRRQMVETMFHILKDNLGLNSIKARTSSGLQVRIAAKIAALNISLLINKTFNLRPLSQFNPIA